MGFSEELIEALRRLGIDNYVIFATGPDGDGFALVNGMQTEIMENVIVGALTVPEIQPIMCRAVLELQMDCEEIEKKGGRTIKKAASSNPALAL